MVFLMVNRYFISHIPVIQPALGWSSLEERIRETFSCMSKNSRQWCEEKGGNYFRVEYCLPLLVKPGFMYKLGIIVLDYWKEGIG